MRITAVTCVKNEGPFLLEWIAWQRLIGVTGLLFYSNDCSDGTDTLLEALAAHGVLHHLPNPAQGRTYQMEALKACRDHPAVQGADWVWIADVDEFLHIRSGDGTIPALIAACGHPLAISVSFQFFGNDGVTDFTDRPVIAQFTRSHDPDIWNGQLAIEVKTLVHRDFPLRYYGAHRPFLPKDLPPAHWPAWTDGSGRAVPRAFLQAANARRLRRFPAKGARAHASLHHYALRSLDSYLVKSDRGDVNREHRPFAEEYWSERADCSHADPAILSRLPALQAGIDALKALPGIDALHTDCVARHRAARDRILATPEGRALRDGLLAAPILPPAETALLAELGLAGDGTFAGTGAFAGAGASAGDRA